MMRLNRDGDYITKDRYLHSIDDIEMTRTQGHHPSVRAGVNMHTNGPSSVWVRRCSHDFEWVDMMQNVSLHKVRLAWMAGGWDAVMAMREATNE